VPCGKDVVVTESVGGGAILIVKSWLTPGAPPLSVTVNVKVVSPDPHGVPTIVVLVLEELVFKRRHAGSVGLLNA
jgi:hypothetical protein